MATMSPEAIELARRIFDDHLNARGISQNPLFRGGCKKFLQP
jgi:hypothetical protein